MRTVIIADDEPITRMDLADMLTELDFQVVGQAGDGFDAVELCRAKRPDVVLSLIHISLAEPHQIRFVWIKGHAGHPENER